MRGLYDNLTLHTTTFSQTAIFTQLEAKIITQMPEITLYLALLSSFDLNVAIFCLHYYTKQVPAK